MTIELTEDDVATICDALRDAIAYCGNYCTKKYRDYEQEYNEFFERFQKKCEEAEKKNG